MSSKVSIYALLKSFASHQNGPAVPYTNFCEYVKKYAQKHVDDQPELTPFVTQPDENIQHELDILDSQKKILLHGDASDKRIIYVISYLVEKYNNRYTELQNNPAVPFPLATDLPKSVPLEIVEKVPANELIISLLEGKHNLNSSILYGLELPKELPVILMPSTTNVNILLEICLSKMRQMLCKEEFHDYFLKKLKIANPGKEISVKNFFNQFTLKPNDALAGLKEAGDNFYFWSQLCFFIKKDYEKVKDYTQEDIAVLQSVYITGIAISFFKNKAQQNLQRATALKNLEQSLSKPPYYFSRDAIAKFVDSRGVPLIGQYSVEDMNNFLLTQSTTTESNELPPLLTFKTISTDTRYYIYKSKVIPLIVRLCSDARETVRDNITKEWYNLYKEFDSTPEMSDQAAFEERLEQEVKTTSPILYALLNSNFLSLVHYETRVSHDTPAETINLFANGKLLSYSELLQMSRSEISTDAKILLPFWYTTPIISWFMSLFMRPVGKKRNKKKQTTKRTVKTFSDDEVYEAHSETFKKGDSSMDRRHQLIKAANALEKKLIPEGSTLDRELAAYEHQWNKLLSKPNADNLTEDVNSLIRDYMRKTIRTLQGSSFTIDRIRNLAEALVATPSLRRIKDQEELTMYVQLYILKLVKSI